MKRKSFHVFKLDKSTGKYSKQVYDPQASVIAYLRNQRWDNYQSTYDAERDTALLDAITVVNLAES